MKLLAALATIAAVQGLKLSGILYERYGADDLPIIFADSPSNVLPISYAPGATAAPTPAPTTTAATTTAAPTTTSAPSTTSTGTAAPASSTTSAPTTASPSTAAPSTTAPTTAVPKTSAQSSPAAAPATPSTSSAPSPSSAVDLFAILRQSAQDFNSGQGSTGTDSSLRQLDSTETLTIVEDNNGPSQSGGRRLDDVSNRDFTLSLYFCNAKSNSIQSYTSTKPKKTTVSSTTSTISGSDQPDAEGKCYDYDVKVDTVSVTAGCNLQNHPEGCDNLYYPGCGGLSVDPKSKQIYVARSGGRSIGKLNYVSSGGSCSGRVLDWLIRYRGKKFNGPADITFTSNGNLYFTDSPFALATSGEELLSTNLTVLDSRREIPFSGVYVRSGSVTQVLDANMTRPRGIALTAEEDILYVANADATHPYIKAFKLYPNGTKECARRFFDFTSNPLNVTGASTVNATCLRKYPSSIKVDSEGFVYAAMCNNIYIFDAAGTLLGRLEADAEVHTLAFGNGYIYISSQNSIFALPVDTSFGNSQETVPNPQNSCDATTSSTQLSESDVSPSKSSSTSPVVGTIGAIAAVAAVALFVRKNKKLAQDFTHVMTPPTTAIKSNVF
ncbi:SMP-30 gluconolaconase LRE domain protein [Aphanomyces cochlioides]|nr:SMP-30 gluconolaconase LRE domain protein [Aphanomyces cochlioides]